MKRILATCILILATHTQAKEIVGSTIKFEIPDEFTAKVLIYPETNLEAYIVQIGGENDEAKLSLVVPDMSRWDDPSFENWYRFWVEKSRHTLLQSGWDLADIPEPQQTTCGEFEGFEVVKDFTNIDEKEIFTIDYYVLAGTKNLNIRFRGKKELTRIVEEILASLKLNANQSAHTTPASAPR
ncbi:hypothetical protein [Pelagicoccus sp. SDUM812003]|uniref:hypothetical protein n=1 Tax=Pelagicoccus sp. SDUM812003 TaxID=3041267 RepID=UPI00280FF42B|nr:hypothetical protein [Pelagicoccus sp. SDUM812003]MDQ8202698.1 hypothetical protein [Pelagicoccus sp. SDUM812003]